MRLFCIEQRNSYSCMLNLVIYVTLVVIQMLCSDYCFLFTFTPISPQFRGIQLLVSLVSSLQLPYGLGRGKGREPCVLKHNPAKPHCFLTQCPLNPEASCTNVSEETLYTWQPCQGQVHSCRPNPPPTWTTLGQLCAAPWVSRSQLTATEPGL
jgi:hypothetical protein